MYFHIAVQIEENGKYYAYAIRVSEADNLRAKMRIPGIVAANICPTKKRAAEIVTKWNAIAKANNEYLFDETF